LSAIEKITGKKLDVKYEPARNYDVERIVLSNRRALEVLGWAPQISFEEGLRQTWNWVCQNG
jgi:UDP-glucose 4-epimerase